MGMSWYFYMPTASYGLILLRGVSPPRGLIVSLSRTSMSLHEDGPNPTSVLPQDDC